jgi:hypothetical protein
MFRAERNTPAELISTSPKPVVASGCESRPGSCPGGPVAGWRLGLETGRVEAQRQKPLGGATKRSAASSETCRVISSPPSGGGEEAFR